MSKILLELSEFLSKDEKKIIENWENASQNDATIGTVTRRLSHSEFVDKMPEALAEFRTMLKRGKPETDDSRNDVVSEHGHHRWKQGFNLRELIRDWGVFNRILINAIMEFFTQKHPAAAKEQQAALDLLAIFLTEATSSSVRRFDELRQAEATGLAHALKETTEKFDKTTQARGRLLREAAHDIRGNLSAIAGASSLLKFVKPEGAKPSLEEVLDSLDRGIVAVKEMLNDLLDLSRLEAGEEKLDLLKVDINQVLEDLVGSYQASASERNLALKFNGEDALMVKTDPQKIKRIAQNLITNALQYTYTGEINVKVSVNDTCWRLIVEDSGPGIQEIAGSSVARELDHPSSQPDRDKGTESFAYAGEGVGLSIVKRLCEILDAGISVESVMGQGTVFTLEFPKTYEL